MYDFVTTEQMYGILRALLTIAVGIPAAYLVRFAVGRVVHRTGSPPQATLGRRVSFYLILGLAAASAFRELGFNLNVLLGAAGVVTVAMGFAAQTSASNLISGLFLVGEKPFVVGEVIQVGGTTGEVIAIDLISVKLRTFDNLYVRLPNETLVKAEIKNLSRHPIRRFDLQVGVAYAEKIGRVREVLMEIAEEDPLCLTEPRPIIIFQGFGDSAVNLQFSVWAARENYLSLRNSIAEKVKEAFDREGIEIPFPHRTLYAGAHSHPLRVAIVSPEKEGNS